MSTKTKTKTPKASGKPDLPQVESVTLLQDDGERDYQCSPTSCDYDGMSYCQNCGLAAGESADEREVQDAIAQPQAQHSPLPWHYVTGAVWTTPEGPDDGGMCIATRASAASIEPTRKDANIRLIVASVNHAQALADALRECLYECVMRGSDRTQTGLPHPATEAARIALAAWDERSAQ